jgi:capsular exopolysaccharide synthesis family protein
MSTDSHLLSDEHLVGLLRPSSWEAEPYRTLRHMLERLRGASQKSLVLAVSSATPGDGKTTTALNLAASLAEGPRTKVLVIDCDLRRGDVARQLGLKGATDMGPGICGAVRNPLLTIGDITWTLASRPFSVVPTGPMPPAPYEILESPQFGALIEQARVEYDFIVIDTPPFIPFADCRVLSRWVDWFALVIGAHHTPRKLIEETLNVVDPSKLLGIIFNGDDSALWGSNRYYAYAAAFDRPAPKILRTPPTEDQP